MTKNPHDTLIVDPVLVSKNLLLLIASQYGQMQAVLLMEQTHRFLLMAMLSSGVGDDACAGGKCVCNASDDVLDALSDRAVELDDLIQRELRECCNEDLA
jgi:hypothetical protein